MKIKAVLFDLDGTLLPMDNDLFIKVYFGKLGQTVAGYGIGPDLFKKALFGGIEAMQKNDGRATNEALFWQTFEAVTGGLTEEQRGAFDYFYENVFPTVKEVCGYTPLAREILDMLKGTGIKLALATAPVFPETATRQRAGWGDIYLSDFDLVTTYENVYHTKPSLEYYSDIAKALNVLPEECIMIGNDAYDDMVASELGMRVFLITDHLVNRGGVDITAYPNGSFADMIEHLKLALKQE